MKKLRIAIPHGDINAIGYELIFKTFAESEMLDMCTPIVYGTPKVAAYHRNALDIPAVFSIICQPAEAREGRLNLLNTIDDELKIDFGQLSPDATRAAKVALDQALKDLQAGQVDCLVLAPSCPIDGKTAEQYIAAQLQAADAPLTILIGAHLRLAFATEGLTLSQVASNINETKVQAAVETFHTALQRDLRVTAPRIALLRTDLSQQTSTPAADTEGGQSFYGPFSAPEFFAQGNLTPYNGILSLYDAQALLAFNCLEAEGGVRFTAGLPYIVCAPQVDNRYTDAGKNQADCATFRQAIYLTIDTYFNRVNYDDPLANPLQKLYHERRDDSEKARFKKS